MGVAGHSLGGGFGLLGRPFGLACDSVLSMEVVDAAGKILTASAQENPDLFDLLSHYAALAAPDRHVWQDRRMQQGESSPRAMTHLHGELIAYGWVEQNTGLTPALRKDEAPACYRITTTGMRALKQVQAGQID